MDLFAAAEGGRGRLPVILEILKSPWVVRASELGSRPGEEATKRLSEKIEVAWNGDRAVPSAFRWRGRRYLLDALVQRWVVERYWWDPRRRVSRRCFRVLARGGVYDLAYDRLERVWLLVGVLD